MQDFRLGKHILVDYYGCDLKVIDDLDTLKKLMLRAAQLANATIVTDVFHKFSPQGVSGVVVIGESHFAIHTWPEYGIVSVDLFTCSLKMSVDGAIQFLNQELGASHFDLKEIDRGSVRLRAVK